MDGTAGAVLAYAATFLAGSLVGGLSTVATFRGALASLQTTQQAHAQQLGALDTESKENRRDITGVANKGRDDLARACAELRAELRDRPHSNGRH